MDEDNVEAGLPDYFFLMLSELSPDVSAGGLTPTGMPNNSTEPLTGGTYDSWLSFARRPDISDSKMFDALILSRSNLVPFGAIVSHAYEAMASVRISMEGMSDFEKSFDDRARREMEDSIGRLALANNAMFTLLAEALGLTEDDLTARMNEIYNASFEKFAARLAENPM